MPSVTVHNPRYHNLCNQFLDYHLYFCGGWRRKLRIVSSWNSSILHQLSANISLVGCPVMSYYAKFMKDLVSFGPANNLHYCSTIAIRFLFKKERRHRDIHYSLHNWCISFCKGILWYVGSINLMSLSIYKQLDLEAPKRTTMRLLIPCQSIKRLVGIL